MNNDLLAPLAAWRPPDNWRQITVIDSHTAGEPFRVITGGFPPLEGQTILERRRYARRHLDHLRTALMWEPRGHADMYGCLVCDPVSPGADFGVLFLHNEGYSTMCGHGIIAMTTVALETGMIAAQGETTPVGIDTPAGLVKAFGHRRDGRIDQVAFHNVPSFVLELDAAVQVPGIGKVRYDLAFGGAFYAFVDAHGLGLELTPANVRCLIETGMAIKRAVMDQRSIDHPFEDDLGFLYGTIFTGPAHDPAHHSRNVCIFADGEVDRSPTGTGVSARLAIGHARGQLAVGQQITIESILGTCFSGKVVETTTFGPHPAVIPEVAGSAHITGISTLVLDPHDPLATGFFLR